MPDETPVEQAVEPQMDAVEAPQAAVTPSYVTEDQLAARFKSLETALSSIAGALTSRQQAPQPQQTQEVTDQELYTLATQGNQEAFRMLQERQADRVVTRRLGESQRADSTRRQLEALYSKYPELGQQGHVLNTRLQAFYQAHRQLGDPETQETHYQAALKAVAESRDVISQRPVQPARNVHPGQMAPQNRRPDAQPSAVPTVTAEELLLAQKMGVKDPAKAKAKFWERNKGGQSRVSPTIAAALGDIQ